jgi:hypothetical protein
VCERTGLMLAFSGYDAESATITRSDGQLALVDSRGSVAASWNFSSLLAHWSRKHSQAAYVPGMKRMTSTVEFRYGNQIELARGTDYLKLLDALASGRVYYDPGIKVVRGDTVSFKKRSQFRVSRPQLASLYHTFFSRFCLRVIARATQILAGRPESQVSYGVIGFSATFNRIVWVGSE